MGTCELCFLPKISNWYFDRSDYAILDCPVCGARMIILKRHGIDDDDADMMGKITREVYSKENCELFDKPCFDVNHSYQHIRFGQKEDIFAATKKPAKKKVISFDTPIKTD